jgi:hypothetical protein
VVPQVSRLKGGSRALKQDFLKALVGDYQTQGHVVLGEKRLQISEAQEADRHIGTCLFNFKGSNDCLIDEPEYIDLADHLLESRLGKDGKRRNAQFMQLFVVLGFAVIARRNPHAASHLLPNLG